jgi:uncharacterized heparinase superfamily protein
MSEPLELTPADSIEAGKRLVRGGGNPGHSLGDWLTGHFYRLTWRTPLHGLRLKGRFPLKLLAVPDDAIPGSAKNGRAIRKGELGFRQEAVRSKGYDFAHDGHSPDFVRHLQSFEWLRDLTAVNDRETYAPIAERLVRDWIAVHGEKIAEPAWQPGIVGRRFLNWAAHAPLILSSSDQVYRSSVLNAFARMARHLDRTADRATQGLERIAAWSGVVAAGLLIAGGAPRLAFGEAGLAKAIATGISEDGGLICRCPQSQLEAVLILSMVRNGYEARKQEVPAFLRDALAALVPALLGVVLGDGGLSSWQGGLPVAGAYVTNVIAGSGIRARPQRHARDWGYQRLATGDTVVVFDAAPPPPARAAAMGCASTLAFELSDGNHRLVTNCGGARGGGPLVPAALAEGLRTTAAHSTLTVADSNSTAILPDGALGKGVSEIELDRSETDVASRAEASHDGYAKRYGLIHKRSLALASDGRELRGEDVLLPAPNRKKPVTVPFALRFHLGPGIEVSPTADAMGALLRIEKGALWQFRCRGGTITLDGGLWIDDRAAPHGTQQLVVAGEAPPGGASISWSLKRAG